MAMAKFTVDTTNKLFIAKAGVTSFDVKVDLYSDAKEHWLADATAMGFLFPIRPVGGDDIVAGESSVPLYGFLRDGWRIRPDEASHTLSVTGGILLVDGGGDPFVDTVGAFTVRINYQQPVQAVAPQAAGLLDLPDGVESGLTMRQALRLTAAALFGKLSGAATTTVTIRDVNDTKDRVVATVDADGNRSAVTVDGS